MNNCDRHEGIMVVWDEIVDSCPLCNMESIFDDLFCVADRLDHEIGVTELAQMPVEIAKKLVSFKKIVQELGVDKETKPKCFTCEHQNDTFECWRYCIYKHRILEDCYKERTSCAPRQESVNSVQQAQGQNAGQDLNGEEPGTSPAPAMQDR